MFTEELLLFVTVTVCTGEVVPTTVLPNLTVLGENVSGEILPPDPVPDRFPKSVGKEALEIAKAPIAVPLAVGVKVTPIVHFTFGAKVPLQGFVPLPAAV
jgi:hypothetical protein